MHLFIIIPYFMYKLCTKFFYPNFVEDHSTLGKRVCVNSVPWVRIPPSPLLYKPEDTFIYLHKV